MPDPPGILVEDSVQARLVELVAAARATVPAKPLTGATVIGDVLVAFVFTLTVVVFEARMKSCRW